jgi:hypothetical protein
MSASIVKSALVLFALGTLSSALGGLFVAAIFKVAHFAYVILVLCLVFAILSIILAQCKAYGTLLRNTLWFLAVIEVISAIVTPLIPFSFHGDDAFLNRAMVYFIILVGLISGVASFWRFLTQCLIDDILQAAGVNVEQETLLYVLWGVLSSFIIAWFLPFKAEYQRDAMFNAAVNYTVGFYFLGGLLAAGLGVILGVKGSGDDGEVAPPPHNAGYDKYG